MLQLNISIEFALFSMVGGRFRIAYNPICKTASGEADPKAPAWDRSSGKSFLMIYLQVLYVIIVNSWHIRKTP